MTSSDITSAATNPEWKAFVNKLAEAGEDNVFSDPKVDTPLLRAEGMRYLTRLLNMGTSTQVENNDPAYPALVRILSPWVQWGYPNPDYDYVCAALHPDYTYRISGQRGSSYILDVEIWEGNMARFQEMATVASRTHYAKGDYPNFDRTDDTLEIGPNGEIDIVISREKRSGNWLPTPDKPGIVMVRFAYGDWEGETSPDIIIEREGAVYPAPPIDLTQLSSQLELLQTFVEDTPYVLRGGVVANYSGGPNTLTFPPVRLGADRDFDTQIGKIGQYYGQGNYECEADEAVVLEADRPTGPYWMYHVMSNFWEAMDWHLRQTSINGHQAVLDSDGKFRAVICPRDPGVPNWLDTGGRTFGVLGARQYSVPGGTPMAPTLTRVKFDELRDILPSDTPTITPEQRHDRVRARALSVQRRRYW